ncbi:hypothetical protein [Alcaligenes sp. Marseille-Q7550]
MNRYGASFAQPMQFIPNQSVVYAGNVVIGRATESLIRQLSGPINDFEAGDLIFFHPRILSFTPGFFHL